MEAAFAVLLVVLCMCICLTVVHHMGEDAKRYKRWYDDEKNINRKLSMENNVLRATNNALKSEISTIKKVASIKANVKNDDMVYAVKYAMAKAHPDNGGKQEDFIKFNSLYNKIRK